MFPYSSSIMSANYISFQMQNKIAKRCVCVCVCVGVCLCVCVLMEEKQRQKRKVSSHCIPANKPMSRERDFIMKNLFLILHF